MSEKSDVDMTVVAAELAQEQVDLKDDLRELVETWENQYPNEGALSPELQAERETYERCARELQKVIGDD